MIGLTRAPELNRPGLHWFNTPAPLSCADLRGRLVILDFWTFCCINCIHVLPILHRVEQAFPGVVQVIGVHSPKFSAEKDPANVAAAIARYGITHPVIHDPNMQLWQEYAIRAWPTLTLISPDGYVIGQVSGEPDPERLHQGLGAMLHSFIERGEMTPSTLAPLAACTPPQPESSLLFPGKIKPLPSPPLFAPAARWAVADAGHHQIAFLDEKGNICTRIGSGHAGFADGQYDHARFLSPQGLAADAHALYIADTGNHAVRRLDLCDGTVTTVAGTGRRGATLNLDAPTVPGGMLELASPWDIEVAPTSTSAPIGIYVANAGSHQIALLCLSENQPAVLCDVIGNGGENLIDGPPSQAQLAQPSGLVLDRQRRILWFADSETSAIRGVTLEHDPADQRVFTLVGQGLFDFGHQDGAARRALLQHPLGLCLSSAADSPDALPDILIADSYNGALRLLTPQSQTISTLDLGLCRDALCLPLGEPAGVWAASPGRILISDTNNHRILEVSLTEGWSATFGTAP